MSINGSIKNKSVPKSKDANKVSYFNTSTRLFLIRVPSNDSNSSVQMIMTF